jgi:hypothetical protein
MCVFYWEEKVSETSFIPHELKHLPVKRGTATVNIKFDGVKHSRGDSRGGQGAADASHHLDQRENGRLSPGDRRQFQRRLGFRPG